MQYVGKRYRRTTIDAAQAVILWEMIGRPIGDDGIRVLQQAIEQTTDDQIKNTLRHLQKR